MSDTVVHYSAAIVARRNSAEVRRNRASCMMLWYLATVLCDRVGLRKFELPISAEVRGKATLRMQLFFKLAVLILH
jgi:hypothetical protein